MNVNLMDEHLKDAAEQQEILRRLHDVASRMRDREIANSELHGCGLYFPKTSVALLDNYADRLAKLKSDNDSRRPVAPRHHAAGPSETTAENRPRRRRARA